MPLECACVYVAGLRLTFGSDGLGQEDFARLRSLSYSETNVIMLCFSVSWIGSFGVRFGMGLTCLDWQADNPISLENIESKVRTVTRTDPAYTSKN